MNARTIFAIAGTLALASVASAQNGGVDFGSAVTVVGSSASGNWVPETIAETLIFSALDQELSSATVTARSYSFTGLAAGSPIRARTAQPAGRAPMDTIMRSRTTVPTTIASNDDFGGTAYSQINFNVPANGNFSIQASYFNNSTYSTTVTGISSRFYDLLVFGQTVTAPGQDVQWYRFTGLVGTLEGGVTASTGFTDTTMALYNSAGTLLIADDDDGAGLLSSVLASDAISAPADGIVFMAISPWRGVNNDEANPANYVNRPTNTTAGAYTVNLIPTPGAAALLGLGGLVALRRRRA